MKANELQIGDYVKNDLGEIQQVVELHKDKVMLAYNDFYSYDDIEFIPLTPEILEKNGFGFVKNSNTKSVWNGWWIYKGLELATACLDKEGNWPCFINIYDSNIKCEYVHQLQHALHLCGIKKEIVLWNTLTDTIIWKPSSRFRKIIKSYISCQI